MQLYMQSQWYHSPSLVPRPLPQLLSLAVRNRGEGLEGFRTWCVPPLTSRISLIHTHSIQLAIACSRDATETRQTPEDRQVLPIQHTSIWNKSAERWLQYNGYNFEAHEALCLFTPPSLWKVQHLQLSTTSKVRLLAWISRCGSLLAVDLSPYAIVASVLVHSGLERMTFYDGGGTHHVRNPSRPSPRFSYCKRQSCGRGLGTRLPFALLSK